VALPVSLFSKKSRSRQRCPRSFQYSAYAATRERRNEERIFFQKQNRREREKKEKNVLFNILGWLLLCSIIRLSAFPFVSNDPTLLLLLVVLYIAPSPPPPPPACISSSSSSSRWDSSTNRSMSRVGIDVFLSLCRRIFPKGTKKKELAGSERKEKRFARSKPREAEVNQRAKPIDRGDDVSKHHFLHRMRAERRSNALREEGFYARE